MLNSENKISININQTYKIGELIKGDDYEFKILLRKGKTIKDIQNRLGDPDIVLESFIISNTYQGEIDWWSKGLSNEKEFENHHVLFQKEDKARYIEHLFRLIIQ